MADQPPAAEGRRVLSTPGGRVHHPRRALPSQDGLVLEGNGPRHPSCLAEGRPFSKEKPMKHLLALLLSVALPLSAQAEAPAVKYARTTTLTFDDDNVEGGLVKPDGERI